MTAPQKPDPHAPDPATLARLVGSVGALEQRLADVARRLEVAVRRMDRAQLEQLAAQLDDLNSRLTDAINAVSPRGAPAPRWDNVDRLAYKTQLDALRTWIRTILRPWYITGGWCVLPKCWDEHPYVIVELSTIAVAWKRAYVRRRPDLELALDWHERILPGAMTRVAAATRNCQGPNGHHV